MERRGRVIINWNFGKYKVEGDGDVWMRLSGLPRKFVFGKVKSGKYLRETTGRKSDDEL